MKRIGYGVALVLTLALLGGCGGGGTGPEDDGSNGDPNGNPNPNTRSIKTDPSYASDIQEIFNRRGCTDSLCHGSSQQEGLDLRSSVSYANLVNVTATQSNVARVIPGNAQGSYLVVKLEGRQTVGTRMPQGLAALDNIDLTNIKNWINQGAKNN
jgi:hypothetical protein